MRLIKEKNRLVIAEGASQVWIEPWGGKFTKSTNDC